MEIPDVVLLEFVVQSRALDAADVDGVAEALKNLGYHPTVGSTSKNNLQYSSYPGRESKLHKALQLLEGRILPEVESKLNKEVNNATSISSRKRLRVHHSIQR